MCSIFTGLAARNESQFPSQLTAPHYDPRTFRQLPLPLASADLPPLPLRPVFQLPLEDSPSKRVYRLVKRKKKKEREKKRKEQGREGKESWKKRCLRRDQKLFHGGDPWSAVVARPSLSVCASGLEKALLLLLHFPPSPIFPFLLHLSLSLCSPALLACLLPFLRRSAARTKIPPFVKGERTKSRVTRACKIRRGWCVGGCSGPARGGRIGETGQAGRWSGRVARERGAKRVEGGGGGGGGGGVCY